MRGAIIFMKQVKFSPTEKIVMDAIEQTGQFTLDQSPYADNTKIVVAIKDLMFRGLIKRKETYANVFIGTAWGLKSIQWNNAVKILNS